MSVRRRLVNTAFGGGQGSPWLRALPADRTLFRVGGGSKTRDNRRNEVERLARALPGPEVRSVRRHLVITAQAKPEHSSISGDSIQSARCESRLAGTEHGAAHFGGTRHGGGMRGGRNDRKRSLPRCKDGVVHGASLPRKTSEPPWSKPASRSKSEARMGHPIISDEVGTQRAPAPPQPRGLARPARSFKRLEGSAAAAGMSEAKATKER